MQLTPEDSKLQPACKSQRRSLASSTEGSQRTAIVEHELVEPHRIPHGHAWATWGSEMEAS
jgi:hypothetical protein